MLLYFLQTKVESEERIVTFVCVIFVFSSYGRERMSILAQGKA